jgi:esterase/lipase superfamily enzyme
MKSNSTHPVPAKPRGQRNLPALAFAALLGMAMPLSGCGGVPVEPLMPTPVLYTELGMGPLDHIPEDQRWNPRRVYFATNRGRNPDLQRIQYTNRESQRVSVGLALIGFGSPPMTWADLNAASKTGQREKPVPLSITGILEAGRFTPVPDGGARDPVGSTAWLLDDLNASIQAARDRDLLVYVHGATVNFYNACAFAAQLDHFMGRDMTSLAFSWPTRQNLFAYGFGQDLARAYRAAPALASLLDLLASHSDARRIHLLAWSAGGRVVTAALSDLWSRHPGATPKFFQNRYRLGTVYYAASEVPRDDFLKALPALNALARRVVVTASAHDQALKLARTFMGGGPRIGEINRELTEAQRQIVFGADRLEVVDLSRGSEWRGFDITGHRYWFDHPWASSDMLLTIRSDLGPAERGLQGTALDLLWWMPPDYPDRLRAFMLRPDLELRREE